MPKSAMSGPRDPNQQPRRLPPARSRDRRRQQLLTLAEDLVEQRLIDGTASPTEVTAIIRWGSEIELANIARVREHTEYLQAQKEKARSETVRQELFDNAMKAMSDYQPSQE